MNETLAYITVFLTALSIILTPMVSELFRIIGERYLDSKRLYDKITNQDKYKILRANGEEILMFSRAKNSSQREKEETLSYLENEFEQIETLISEQRIFWIRDHWPEIGFAAKFMPLSLLSFTLMLGAILFQSVFLKSALITDFTVLLSWVTFYIILLLGLLYLGRAFRAYMLPVVRMYIRVFKNRNFIQRKYGNFVVQLMTLEKQMASTMPNFEMEEYVQMTIEQKFSYLKAKIKA